MSENKGYESSAKILWYTFLMGFMCIVSYKLGEYITTLF